MASKHTDNNFCFDVDVKELRIATLNVRCLKNLLKQSSIVKSLRSFNVDILGLQETHLLLEEENNLCLAWNGPCIFAEGTNNSKGLAILFSNKFTHDQISVLLKNDRILLCSIKIKNETFYICNIYAPNEINSKIMFYKKLTSRSIIKENLDEQ